MATIFHHNCFRFSLPATYFSKTHFHLAMKQAQPPVVQEIYLQCLTQAGT